MKVRRLITYLTVLSLVFSAQVSAADDQAGAFGQFSQMWQKAQVVAKEKIVQIKVYFEGKLAEWSGQKPTEIAQLPTETQQQPTNVAGAAASGVMPQATTNSHAQNSVTQKTLTQEQTQFAEIINHTKGQVQGKEVVKVLKEGRAGATVLPKAKSGVPVFALSRKETKKDKKGNKKVINISVSEIPQLDIGLEKSIEKNDLLPPKTTVNVKLKSKIKELETPKMYSQSEITKWQKMKFPVIAKATPPKRGDFQLGQIVTQKKIEAVSIAMLPTKPLENLKPVVEISRDDLKLMAALMLFNKGDKCHLASGLFIELSDKRDYAEESNFYLGVCAHQMGFHSEAVSRLLKVIESENPEFLKEAITNLVEDLPREHDVKVAAAIKGLKNRSAIEDKAQDNLNFVLARAAHEAGQFGEAVAASEKVSEASKHYTEARYLYSIGLYGQKKLKDAEESLLKLREWMVKHGKSDKNIESLIAVNAARIRFMQGRYQSALEEYAKIPKDQPLWVQGLIEQGWTQLNTDDPEGAVGNMYSLHSPYFKAVFMPESWVVRTIGYINICQFGDAYRTLSRLEQLHNNWLSAVYKYTAEKKNPNDFYNTVRTYIKGKSDQNVDGLPYQVIREIARQRGFLNAQNALNVKEDEIVQYNFIYGLVKRDQADVATKLKRTRARLAKTKEDLKKVKNNSELAKNLNEWNANRRNDEQLVSLYEFQTEIFEQARKGYLKLKASALSRIDKEKSVLRTLAGRELMSHLKDIQSRITQIFEGNEFLRYEIFAGSGENIRFQVSGGDVDNTKRIPANVKPQKMLNWEFDGEYWEDEIGSYRSSLKNNCPKSARAAQVTSDSAKKNLSN